MFSKRWVSNKVPEEVPLFLEIPEFPFNTLYRIGGRKPHAETRSIGSSVSAELRLVTARRTQGYS